MNHEQVARLCEPFAGKDHEFNYSKKIYISEDAITTRLDEVDPGWSFTVTRIEHRSDKVVVYAALTVCGVTRESNGYDEAEYQTGKPREPQYEVNQREKAALTDALKRCARLFGIGRYILNIPDSVRDDKALAAWLHKTYRTQPAIAPKPNTSQVTEQEWTAFQQHWFNHAENLSYNNLLDALGIPEPGDDIRAWRGTLPEAHATVAQWCKANPRVEEKTA